MCIKKERDISKKTFIIALICIILVVSSVILYFGYRIGIFGGVSQTSDISSSESIKALEDFEYELVEGGISIIKYNGSAKDIVIPDEIEAQSIVEIGQRAFAGSKISSVVIPNTVKIINIEAFTNCSFLERATLPEALTTIAYSAFSNCLVLESIVFPSKVNIVGDNAFKGCTALKDITLSENILYFGADVFGGTAWSENIKEGIVTIGGILYKFYGDMPENYKLIIPEGIKTIATQALFDFDNLVEIKYPKSLKNIGIRAFADCEGLTTINLPEGIRRIGSGAFEGCLSVKEVSISSTVTEIDEGAFFACKKLEKLQVAEENNYFYSDGSALFSKGKTRLLLFCPESSQTDYVFPESVASLDEGAFFGCKRIKNLTLSELLTEIPMQAFFGCEAITSLAVPESVTTIYDFAFFGCKSLVYIKLPESLEKIGQNVFSYCKSLESFGLSENCESFVVKDGILFSKDMSILYSFPAKSSQRKYTVEKSVKRIERGAFLSAAELTGVELPESLESIADEAFMECESLSSISIPSNVTAIGSLCFKGCVSLKSITIGKSVNSIGQEAFIQCYSLKNFYMEEGNASFVVIDCVIYSADKTKLISYPSNKSTKEFAVPKTVKSIDNYAFYACFNLERIILPTGISGISPEFLYKCPAIKAFEFEGKSDYYSVRDGVLYNSDKSVLIKYPSNKSGGFFAIPETVLSIPNYAFENCRILRKIEIGKSVSAIMPFSFFEMDSLKLICPKDSYAQSYAEYSGFDYELT